MVLRRPFLARRQFGAVFRPGSLLHVASDQHASPEAASTGTDPDSILTIKKRVDEVNVLFIATDHHGKFVRNLNQGDFTILDDHKPPQSIVNFRRETDLPLKLGLLVDTSGSVHSRFDFEQEAAVSFHAAHAAGQFRQSFCDGLQQPQPGDAGFHRQRSLLARGCTPAQWRRHRAL